MPYRRAGGGVSEQLVTCGPAFTASVVQQIETLRHQLVANPVIDEWLSTVDPAIARTPQDIDAFASFLADHADRWDRLASRLDDASRDILRAILLLRAVGYRHYVMPWVTDTGIKATYAAAQGAIIGPALATVAPPYPMFQFDIDHCGSRLQLEAWLGNIAATFIAQQYVHPKARIRPGDVVIDGGACFGDTALAFAAEAGPDGRVISFEPDAANQQIFRHNIGLNPALSGRVTLIGAALSNRHGCEMPFQTQGAASRIVPGGGVTVRSVTLDQMVEDGRLDRVDFIKLDIEFHEAEALRGASQVIGAFKPRLAIAAYHRPDDLLSLSEQILETRPDYCLHLGHITSTQSETVLFAT